MRTAIHDNCVQLNLSDRDTYDWAHRSGSSWPGSTLSDHRLMAYFDRNGLADLTVDGKDAPDWIDGTELSAICADHLNKPLRKWMKKEGYEHPIWFVAVGQFLQGRERF